MQLFNNALLRQYHIDTIRKIKMTLEDIWTIECWYNGDKIENRSTKKLRDMMWIKDDKLTSIAEDTYNALLNMEEPKSKEKKKSAPIINTEYDEQWSQLWSIWPKTDAFIWKGREFPATRSMRANEIECKKRWLKAVLDGKEPEKIYHATQAMFSVKKEESVRRGQNQVTYLNALLPWLNQKGYESWENVKIIEEDIKESSMFTEA